MPDQEPSHDQPGSTADLVRIRNATEAVASSLARLERSDLIRYPRRTIGWGIFLGFLFMVIIWGVIYLLVFWVFVMSSLFRH